MSSLVTAYICEEDALNELIQIFKKTEKTAPVKKKILEFMREAASSPARLNYGILVITGLSELLKAPYGGEDTIPRFREALRNLSRETTLLVQVREVKWMPAKRSQITVDGVIIHVSDIDVDTTLKLEKEYIGTDKKRGNRNERFVIVKL